MSSSRGGGGGYSQNNNRNNSYNNYNNYQNNYQNNPPRPPQHHPHHHNGHGHHGQGHHDAPPPRPLRQPNLTPQQVLAAVELGFTDKQYDKFPEVGEFCVQDWQGGDKGEEEEEINNQEDQQGWGRRENNKEEQGGGGEQQQEQYQGWGNKGEAEEVRKNRQEEEGALPPLRRPNLSDVPPDVLAELLKSSRFEELLSMQNQQDQQQRQNQHLNQNPNHQQGSSSYQHQPPQGHQGQGQVQQQQPPQAQPQQQQGHQHQDQRHQGQVQQQQQQQPQQRRRMSQEEQQPSPQGGGGQGQGFNNNNKGFTPNPNAKEFNFAPNPNAKEFVPSFGPPEMNQEESELAEAIAQFQFQQGNGHGQQGGYAGGGGDFEDPSTSLSSFGGGAGGDEYADYVLSTVTDRIMELTENPASFNRCAKNISECLKQHCHDLDTLTVVMTLIVEQCISNQNFCYSGARLVDVLVKNGIDVNGVSFRKLLLTRCQEEFSNCVAQMDKDPLLMARCLGVLHFFGELFMNLRIEQKGVMEPMNILGYGILDMMQALVKEPSHENIRAVFQVLKLVGWMVDSSTDATMKSKFEQLLKDMSYLCMNSSTKIEPRTKSLLDMLFSLKNNKWGRSDGESSGRSSSASSTTSSQGQGQTQPPTSASNFYELPDSDEDDVGEDDCILLDDEPEEVRRAYDEFLKTVK